MSEFNPLYYPILFFQPEYIIPTVWARNIPTAMFAVYLTEPKTLVDVGADSAVPYTAFCQAVKELHLRTHCFGLGSWGRYLSHGNSPEVHQFSGVAEYIERRYGEFSTLISDGVGEPAEQFQAGSIDLLHIGHSYSGEQARYYFETWLPKMSEQGVILMDAWPGQQSMSWFEFWEKIKLNHACFGIEHEHGLRIIVVGTRTPQKLKQTILDQSEGTKRQIEEFLVQRGNSLIPLFEAKEKDAEIEQLRTKAYQMEQSNHILRYEKAVLTNSLQRIQDSVAEARNQGRLYRFANAALPPGSNRRKAANRFLALFRNVQAPGRTTPTLSTPPSSADDRPFGDQAARTTKPSLSKEDHVIDRKYTEVYLDLLSRAKNLSERYVPITKKGFDHSKAPVKLIAFYLPQFHPIPENDQWWGKGFTEWTNVSKAVPNFAGHYQPRLPDELNFYDLRIPEIQKRQVELAKMYGIYGFCFYYYWFNGKRLLELPLNQFIENNELDFPFCICWGNENWTRRWDGAEHSILIGQTYSEEEYTAFIRDIASILTDKRYIRIEGKPLLAVYRVNLLVDPQRAVEIWRSECRKLGIGEIYLAAVQSFEIEDPRPYGFDSAIEFPPHNCLNIAAAVDLLNLPLTNPHFTGNVFDYRKAAELMTSRNVPDYVQFKTVMPSWDNTARRQNDSVIFFNSSPTVYRNWLVETIEHTRKILPQEKRFVFINAWNEWAEGAYLEPDRFYGYAYLQATKEALESIPTKQGER